MEKVGEIIARERRALGWSQELLASKVGMVSSAISKAERGANIPHPTNLCAIADALKISRDVLLVAAGLMDPEKAETLPVYFRADVATRLRLVGKVMGKNDSDTLTVLLDLMAETLQEQQPHDRGPARIPPPEPRGTHTKGGKTTVLGGGGQGQK